MSMLMPGLRTRDVSYDRPHSLFLLILPARNAGMKTPTWRTFCPRHRMEL